MKTYKVGDEITIKNNLQQKWYGLDQVVQSMLKYKGKKAIINGMVAEGINFRFYLDIDNQMWTWTKEMFEDGD